MTKEHVVWAGAICVEKQYGDDGAVFIHARIGDLMDDNDIMGVEMWAKIGSAYDRLAGEGALIH